jgi:phage tail sheath gpL-like
LKMIDAHAYIGVAGTHAALVTKGTGRNSPHVSMIGAKGSPTPPWEWAAVLGGQCAFYGKQDPARPFQTLELTGLMAPVIADRFTFQERDILLRSGISTFTVDEGGLVRIERVITTYRENPFGAPDISYLDLNTLKTLTYLRFDLRAFIALRYPRYKLADDGTIFSRGQAVVTPKVIRASIVARFRAWEEAGLVENIEQFKKDLIVERDSLDPNRVNALVPPDIVNQLVVFAGLVQFRL